MRTYKVPEFIERVEIKLPVGVKNKLRQAAAAKQMQVGPFIRHIIVEYMKKEKI